MRQSESTIEAHRRFVDTIVHELSIKGAVEAFYFDGAKPAAVRMHLVRDEMLAFG